MTDLKAPRESTTIGLGPIAQAIVELRPDKVVFMSDFKKEEITDYIKWLDANYQVCPEVKFEPLSSPTNFGEIYKAAVRTVNAVLTIQGFGTKLTFHLSPGTPAMAAVWIILAKTRFPAELIESSRERGVRTVSVPFDISAEFIPDLLRGPDRNLERSCAGLSPEAPAFRDIIHQSETMRRSS